MREYKRLAAAADVQFDDSGVANIAVTDFNGGDFDLQPRMTEDGIVLAHPTNPAYSVKFTGDTAALGRLGKALLAFERGASGDSSDEGA